MGKLLVGGILFIVGLVVLGLFVAGLVAGLATIAWPTTTAEVLAASVRDADPESESRYALELAYRYTVNDRSYEGSRFRFGEENFSPTRSQAESIIADIQVGDRIAVRYDPRDPASALIRAGPHPGILLALVMGLSTITFGYGVAFTSSLQLLINRLRGIEVPAAIPGGTTSIGEADLTPSERLLIAGTASLRRRSDAAVCLDGGTGPKRLLKEILEAALLAHVQAGSLRLERGQWTARDGKTGEELQAVPTGTPGDFPHDSLEGRLLPDATMPVREVVGSWLAHRSPDPSARGLEKLKILLTLRGLARPALDWRGRQYRLAVSPSADELSAVRDSAEALRRSRDSADPALLAEITREIEKGIRSRLYQGDDSNEVDPWNDEAKARSAPFLTQFSLSVDKRIRFLIGLIPFAWIIAVTVLVTSSDPRLALVLSALALIAWLLDQRWRYADRSRLAAALYIGVGLPLIFIAVSLVPIALRAFPLPTVAVLLAAVFFGSSRLFRRKVIARISAIVAAGGGSEADALAPAPEPAAAESPTAAPGPIQSGSGTPPAEVLTFRVIDPDALPEGSAEGHRRLAEIRRRGMAINKVYTRGLWIAVIGVAALSVLAWQLNAFPNEGSRGIMLADGVLSTYGDTAIPTGILVFLGASVLLLMLTVFLWPLHQRNLDRIVRSGPPELEGGTTQHIGQPWRREVMPVRPIFFPLLGLTWAVLGIRAIRDYALAAAPWQYVLILGSIAVVLLYFWYLARERARVERQFPVYPRLNLLALRVFNSSDLNDYVGLIDRWHWFGPVQMLDGPDSSGRKIADFVRLLIGKTEDAIVKTPEELAAWMSRVEGKRNRQLRFPTTATQCNNRIWTQALDRMLDQAHVVVMDLSGFSIDNTGVVYELTRLIDRVPLGQFTLLVNSSTDMEALKAVLEEAWQSRAPDSANADASAPTINLFDIGGGRERELTETQQHWQRRLQSRIDRDRLSVMLFDAAVAGANASESPDPHRPEHLAWGGTMLPDSVERLLRIGLLLYMLGTLAVSWPYMTATRGPF